MNYAQDNKTKEIIEIAKDLPHRSTHCWAILNIFEKICKKDLIKVCTCVII